MNKKVKTESETRNDIINQALRFYGKDAAIQVKAHFDKWDKIIKNSRNEQERSHMKKIALAELYKLMQYNQGLLVNGEEIIPPDKK